MRQCLTVLPLMIVLLFSGFVSANGNGNGNSGRLNSDAFMKMLLTQLKYQDPTAPMDNAQMVSQLADLTKIQQNAELVQAMDRLRNQMYQSQGLYASNLVGKGIMVIANLFKVKEGQLPRGEVLLQFAAKSLRIEVYKEKDKPDSDKPLATLKLGKQKKSGKVPFNLDNLDKKIDDGTYMMYAYADVDGEKQEQAIIQQSVVLNVVIPGGDQDVLVEAKAIGLVPLHAITEFQGDYVPPAPKPKPEPYGSEPSPQAAEDPFASLAGHMEKTMREGERWTINPFFKPQSVRSNQRQESQPVSRRDVMFRRVN